MSPVGGGLLVDVLEEEVGWVEGMYVMDVG